MTSFFRLFICLLCTLPGLAQPIIRVTENGAGDQSGTSWSNALSGTSLAGYVATATSGTQFWVAAGTYKPTTTTDRTASFSIASGVSVYGGFVGNELSSTDVINGTNETILSGDIGVENSQIDNSEHVISLTNISQYVYFVGLTISGGYNGDEGAGIKIVSDEKSPIVILHYCKLINNKIAGGMSGGGAISLRSRSMAACSLLVDNCYFNGNEAGFGGAIGLYTAGGTYNATISNSIFEANVGQHGGAISSWYTENSVDNSLTIWECDFTANSARTSGGAIRTGGGVINATNCSFTSNKVLFGYSDQGGGAIDFSESQPTFTNCLFVKNSAFNGGALYGLSENAPTTPYFINCTFTENSAFTAGGVIATKYIFLPPAYLKINRTTFTNCIAWDNTAPVNTFFSPDTLTVSIFGMQYPVISEVIATFSDIQGGYPGNGNINNNPLFVSPAAGNYQLLASSPAVNAGDVENANSWSIDLNWQTRIQNGRVDMGAYEFTCSTTVCVPVTVSRKQ